MYYIDYSHRQYNAALENNDNYYGGGFRKTNEFAIAESITQNR